MVTNKEKLFALGKKMTDRVPYRLGLKKLDESCPEYWGLVNTLDDEMVEIALSMPQRVPQTLAQIAKSSGWTDTEKLEAKLHEMGCVGLIEWNWENPQHEKQYLLPLFVPGAAEFLNMRKSFVDEHPEVCDFFNKMTRLPIEKITAMVPPGGAGIGMHVIPVEKAIPTESKSVSLEHLSHWLKKYDYYAAGVCSCRRSQTVRGEGSGDLEDYWCIAVGDCARYSVETGKDGHEVSYDEVMEILRRAEEEGYVHQITNIDGEDKIFAICNCAPGVCYALRTSQLFNTPNMSRSAYIAHVDMEKCVACGKCVEVCPAGAAKLGQKLCTKNGPVAYPKHELPDDTKWGPEKWDEDYRDNNMINCYDSGTAPCKTACPAHIAVQGYIKMAAEGRYLDALKLIKQDNPFPAVCGSICNRRCEAACTRGTVDDPVAIDEIKKFIAEQELHADRRYIPAKRTHRENTAGYDKKIAVIGAGPAGLSCAYYLANMSYPVTVFEKNEVPGGMLTLGIPSFRLEKDVVNSAPLGIPGEELTGVFGGVEFMREVNLDKHPAVGRRCAVIGGGNVAMDVCRSAVRLGAEETYVIYRRSEAEMPADKAEVAEAVEEGVRFRYLCAPVEIIGDGEKVTALKVELMELGEADEKGRRKPVGTGRLETIEVDSVISAIGQKVDLGGIAPEGMTFNRNGTVIADPVTLQTAQPDVFVGGDALTGPKFAIDAIAAGREAAESLHRYVHPGQSLTLARNRRQFIELNKDDVMLPVESFDNSSRQTPGTDKAKAKSFAAAAARPWWTRTSASAAGCAPRGASSTRFTSAAICRRRPSCTRRRTR